MPTIFLRTSAFARLRPVAGTLLILALWSGAPASRPAAQSSAPFTAEDMMRVATVNVLDLSEDGRLVAVAVRRPVDNPETDHGRFGDPTYLNPSRVSVMIVDTRTGRSWTPFRELVEARGAAWSRDGRRLGGLLGFSAAPHGSKRRQFWRQDRARAGRVSVAVCGSLVSS